MLKESQRNSLPERVLNRRKRGFNAPVSHWFGGEFEDMAKRIRYCCRMFKILNGGSMIGVSTNA
ncbi:MAG: hypothetical protein HOM25_08225 [Rhodospirillaceae bacterium]|nr:hypothetical protein [Rhodospirillaceae bacterium]MBT5812537.1 hypothetical protein [Rhodospirillaceae bacterium]